MPENDHDIIRTKVTRIWREVLGASPEQPAATFFDLSGQSISAVRIVARIEDELGIAVDLGELFEDPDLHAFVRVVAEAAKSDQQA